MRAFVTGAAGYAGFYAALRLAAVGHTVTGIVRHPEQPRLNILRIQEVTLLSGDVGQTEAYNSELARSDVIIHTMLDKKRPLETDRALFGALQSLPPRTPRTSTSRRWASEDQRFSASRSASEEGKWTSRSA